ncbi:MAG: NINE protein [Janthinobacterium lividum]
MNIAAYEAERKSTVLAYVLWFFLGSLGVHRFYAAATRSGLILLAIHLAGWAAITAAWLQGGLPVRETTTGPGFSSTTVLWASVPNGPLGTLGAVLLGIVGIWVFVDLFLTYGLVRRYNALLATRVGA